MTNAKEPSRAAILNALEEAAQLIEKKGWTQGFAAQDAHGRTVDPKSPEAVCYCLVGALGAAATSEVSQGHLYELLTKANKDTFAHPYNLGQTVFAWVWNDYYATSAVQVAAAIRKAKEAV
jgi:hypothetical protein